MTQEQKRGPKNAKTLKKDEGSIGHQRAVCPGF